MPVVGLNEGNILNKETWDAFSTSGSFNGAPDLVPPAFNTFMLVTEDEVYKCISEPPLNLLTGP